jgi:hypothetical protein
MERMTSPRSASPAARPARPPVVTLTTPDGDTRHLPSKGAFLAPAGSVVDMITPGSGGFGAVDGARSRRHRPRSPRRLCERARRAEDYGIADPQVLRAAAEKDEM